MVRLEQIPGITITPNYMVKFKVSSKRHPNQNQRFHHPCYVKIRDFMRITYSINHKEAEIFVKEKRVEIKSGRDYYTMEFD